MELPEEIAELLGSPPPRKWAEQQAGWQELVTRLHAHEANSSASFRGLIDKLSHILASNINANDGWVLEERPAVARWVFPEASPALKLANRLDLDLGIPSSSEITNGAQTRRYEQQAMAGRPLVNFAERVLTAKGYAWPPRLKGPAIFAGSRLKMGLTDRCADSPAQLSQELGHALLEFAQSSHAQHLQDFALYRANLLQPALLGEPGPLLGQLTQTPLFEGLTMLGLSGCKLGDDAAIRALALAPHLQQLEVLDLSGTGLGVSGLRTVLDSPKLKSLEAVELMTNDLEASTNDEEFDAINRQAHNRGLELTWV